VVFLQCSPLLRKFSVACQYTVIQNFWFPQPKRKFRVQKFYPKHQVFEPELRDFEPKLQVLRTETSGFTNRNFGFSKRNFVFLNQSCSFCKDFFCLTETSGVNSGIFCDPNFGISNPYEVSNNVSVERKPEKFSKFQAKMNYSV
jgi:hypothetical protein